VILSTNKEGQINSIVI